MGATGGGVWKTENYGITWMPVTRRADRNRIDRRDRRGRFGSERRLRRHRQRSDSFERDPRARRVQVDRRGQDVAVRRPQGRRPDRDSESRSEGSEHRVRRRGRQPVRAGGPTAASTAPRDGGKTWQKVLFINDQTGAVSVAINWSNPNEVYAARGAPSASHGRSSAAARRLKAASTRSTDGGDHWTRVSNGLPDDLDRQGLGRRRAVEPESASTRRSKAKGAKGGLYRSDDGGATWTLVNNSSALRARPFYFNKVFVNPKDENDVWVTELGLHHSTDGGKTLEQPQHAARRQPHRLDQSG